MAAKEKDGRVVYRAPRVMLVGPVMSALSPVSTAFAVGQAWIALGAAIGLAWAWTSARPRTVAEPAGLTVTGLGRARRLGWDDVATLEPLRNGTAAVTRDGERVGLPWVEWRPAVPDEYAAPASAQRLAAYAREHGFALAADRG